MVCRGRSYSGRHVSQCGGDCHCSTKSIHDTLAQGWIDKTFLINVNVNSIDREKDFVSHLRFFALRGKEKGILVFKNVVEAT